MADIDFCEYVTGLPPVFYDLLIAVETTGEWTQFYIDDTVEVDWGSGHFLTYGEGIVYGQQVYPKADKPILIRSQKEFSVKTLRFGSGSDWDNTYLSINILKAADLVDATKLCYRLESLHTFTFFGNNQIASFESAWEDCTELLQFDGMDTTRAVTFKRAWKNVNNLISFPNIYARECLTVEEAWMGCTSMLEFPIIDVSQCLNFRSAWRGNVNLLYFPFCDVSSGTNFDHAWAYNTRLSYFPSLDFSSALNMDYAFAYMKLIKSFPFVDSPLSTSFHSTFRKMLALKCIGGVDTNGVSSRDFTTNMFYLSDKLEAPTIIEQEQIRDGYRYVNSEPCYYNAGRSTFFAVCRTNGEETSFEIKGGDFEVNWGDGLFLPYNEGFVSDIPIDSNTIQIRSEEDITQILFHDEDGGVTNTFLSVEIKRGRTLTDVTEMCKGLTNLEYFEMLGYVKATNYTSILEGCINLIDIGEFHLENVTSLNKALKNCKSLITIEENQDANLPVCTDFYETYYGCKSIVHLPKLITPVGKDFTRMFAEMDLFECLDGIDTRNQTTTFNMFTGSDAMVRPNSNEQAVIMNPGMNYDNLGNCGGALNFNFTGNGNEVTFQVNSDVFVDWGDAIFVPYSANTDITNTPVGHVYVIGDIATSITFVSDNFVDVEFTHTEHLISMKNMFLGKTTLNKFTFTSDNNITDCESAFENSGITEFISTEFVACTIYTNMFKGTLSLVTTHDLKTVVGTEFEGMFENSAIRCIKEIYTCYGNFPPNYLHCHGDAVMVCDTDVSCDQEYEMCPSVACGTDLNIFAPSSMFSGAINLVNPDTEYQEKITNRYHYIGIEPC